jgi:iron-sulfur cluster assembly protein
MITLTEKAAIKVKVQVMNRECCYGIRVGVRTTGCSGLGYLLEYVDKLDPNDLCFRSNGVNVYVDPKSLPYVDGLVMDWKREGLNEGFDFQNPNVKDQCGCGESFRV